MVRLRLIAPVLWCLLIPAPAQPADSVRGVVVQDGKPLASATVQFLGFVTAGIPGLHSDAEEVFELRATSGRDGRFRLPLPAGICGSLVAEAPGAVAFHWPVQCGDTVVLDLQPARLAQVTWQDARPGEKYWVWRDGPAGHCGWPAAVPEDRVVQIALWPRHEVEIELPPGAVDAPGGARFVKVVDSQTIQLHRVFDPGPLADGLRACRSEPAAWWGTDPGAAVLIDMDGVRHSPARPAKPCRTQIGAGRAAVLVHGASVEAGVWDSWQYTVARRADVRDGLVSWPGAPEGEPALVCLVSDPQTTLAGSKDGLLSSLGTRSWLGGSVRDSGSAPLHGARVFVRPVTPASERAGSRFAGVETATRSSGRWQLPLLLGEGEFEILATSSDGRFAWRQFRVPAGRERLELDLVLQEGARVEGEIVDAGGDAVAGALVRMWSGSEPTAAMSFGVPLHAARTDQGGAFRMLGLDPLLTYELYCATRRGQVMAGGLRAGAPAFDLVIR
jgi:hypothetical protein